MRDPDTHDKRKSTEGLQSFWNDIHELVKNFGTPELDDQVWFFVWLIIEMCLKWSNHNQLSGAIYMQGYPKEVA